MGNEDLNKTDIESLNQVNDEKFNKTEIESLNEVNDENPNETENESLNKVSNENLNKTDTENSSELVIDSNYKEVQINKMIINGKEQEGNLITIDDTRGKQEINVKVYTQDIEAVPNKEEGKQTLHEWIKKGIFRNKRK